VTVWTASETTDALVIGGGVLGCAIALRLAQRGFAAILIERGEPGGEASFAAAGILGAQMESHGPGPLLSLQLASRALHPALAEELFELTGVDVRCRIEGVQELAFTEQEAADLRERYLWQKAAGLRVEWQSAERPIGTLSAMICPDDGQVDNRKLSHALHLAAERSGVKFLRAEALEIESSGARVSSVRIRDAKGERKIATPIAVVAAGSWSALVAGARIAADSVRPVRGQMISLSVPEMASSRVLSTAHGYAVPRGDRVLVGATVEETGFVKANTEPGVASLRALANRLACVIPELENAPILEQWSGLRPGSRDGLPLIGAPANAPTGTFVCTGHYRSGILLTPISAELIRDAVLGEPIKIDLAPFQPDRF
jgi:glycine oxidase